MAETIITSLTSCADSSYGWAISEENSMVSVDPFNGSLRYSDSGFCPTSSSSYTRTLTGWDDTTPILSDKVLYKECKGDLLTCWFDATTGDTRVLTNTYSGFTRRFIDECKVIEFTSDPVNYPFTTKINFSNTTYDELGSASTTGSCFHQEAETSASGHKVAYLVNDGTTEEWEYSGATLPDNLFQGNAHLTSLYIPNNADNLHCGVSKIGSGLCFGCTNLSSVTIGDEVTEIGTNAFCNCSSLEKVNFEHCNNETSPSKSSLFVGESAFNSANLSSVVISGYSDITLDFRCFLANNNLSSMTISCVNRLTLNSRGTFGSITSALTLSASSVVGKIPTNAFVISRNGHVYLEGGIVLNDDDVNIFEPNCFGTNEITVHVPSRTTEQKIGYIKNANSKYTVDNT